MGYTHYFTQRRELTEEEWSQLCAVTRTIIAQSGVSIRNGWGEGEPEISPDRIALNGDEDKDEAYETFSLTRQIDKDNLSYYEGDGGGWFDFCKTQYRPYDVVVCAVLLAVTEIAPGAYSVSSDGNMQGEDWQPARELLKSLAPKPARVDNPGEVANLLAHLLKGNHVN